MNGVGSQSLSTEPESAIPPSRSHSLRLPSQPSIEITPASEYGGSAEAIDRLEDAKTPSSVGSAHDDHGLFREGSELLVFCDCSLPVLCFPICFPSIFKLLVSLFVFHLIFFCQISFKI